MLREILDDPDAAFRSDAVLYQDFLVRCRIRRVPGEPLNLSAFRRRLAVARAGVDAQTAEGDHGRRRWSSPKASPMICRACSCFWRARRSMSAPCPSNAALARAYGTHSQRRAHRLLAYFEERGLMVVRTDFHGRRILAFPDLGCETAPGDPNAAEDFPLGDIADGLTLAAS